MSEDSDFDGLHRPAGEAVPPGRRPLWMVALAVLVALLALIGLYTRQARQSQATDSPSAPGALLLEAQARGTSLTAVGRAVGLATPCTAWLLEAGADDSDTAYAVTAGRCVGVEDSATVVTGRALSGASIEFNTFADRSSGAAVEPVVAAVDEVVWASARGTDLAILRLRSSYGELQDRGVRAITAVAPPEQSAEILVAGVPVEGIGQDQQHLRGSRCAIGVTTDVAEAPWTFEQLLASDCAGVLDGSAGAPAFNPAGQAVGMVTTTTIGAPDGVDCAAGRPCEVRDGSTDVVGDTSYLVPVDLLADCFPEGSFALGNDCALEDPTTVVPARAQPSVGRPGSTVQISIGAPGDDVPGDAPAGEEAGGEEAGGAQALELVPVASGRLGEVTCSDQTGWFPLLAQAEGTVEVTLPTDEGYALICVGSPQQPTALMVAVDGTAPDTAAIELAQVPVEGGVQVAPVPAPPELATFLWVSGPAGAIDCAAAEGYTAYRGQPAVIEAADLPSTVCVIAVDEAGNASAPAAIDVA